MNRKDAQRVASRLLPLAFLERRLNSIVVQSGSTRRDDPIDSQSQSPLPLDYAPPAPRGRRWYQFTLVELLIILGIIAVLVAILLPTRSDGYRSAQTQCASNLRAVAQQIFVYANVNGGALPESLQTMLRDPSCAMSNNNLLVCPRGKQTPSKARTLTDLAKDLDDHPGIHLSFTYVGAGRTIGMPGPSRAVLLYELAGNHAAGSNVLFADGHVEFLPLARFQRLLAELTAGHNPPRAEMMK